MNKAVLTLSLVLLLILSSPLCLNNPHAAERQKVAILGLEAMGVEKELADILADLLADEVTKIRSCNCEVITRNDIKAMLDLEAQKQMMGCEDSISCLAEIGGALGVDRMISGSLGIVGEIYVLTFSLVNVRAASVENRVSEKIRGGRSELVDKIGPMARKLFGEIARIGIPTEGKGDIFIKSTYKGSSVYIDGKYKGVTPITLKDIPAGSHVVRVEKDIYAGVANIYLSPDELERVDIEMSKKRGGIKIYSEPEEALLYLDGEYVGKSPLILKDIELGTHKIKAEKEGLWPYEETLQLTREEAVSVTARLKEAGLLNLVTAPGAVSVKLDGKEIGYSPLKKLIEQGSHEITLSRKGYISLTRKINIQGGEESVLNYKLLSKPILSVNISPKGAIVDLDVAGRRIGERAKRRIGEKEKLTLNPGVYTIEVKKRGYVTEKKKVSLKGGDEIRLDIRLKIDHRYATKVKKARKRNRIISLSSIGIALAGAGGAYYFRKEAEGAHDNYRMATVQGDMDKYRDDVRSNNTLTNISVGAGIAGLSAAVISYLIAPRLPEVERRNTSLPEVERRNTSLDVLPQGRSGFHSRRINVDYGKSTYVIDGGVDYGKSTYVIDGGVDYGKSTYVIDGGVDYGKSTYGNDGDVDYRKLTYEFIVGRDSIPDIIPYKKYAFRNTFRRNRSSNLLKISVLTEIDGITILTGFGF